MCISMSQEVVQQEGRVQGGAPGRWLVAGSLPFEETVISVLMQQGSRVCIRNDKMKYQQIKAPPRPPINRKQEPDKNTILFAAVASTTQVAEGHALGRKCDCFWKEEVAKLGGCGEMRRRKVNDSPLLGWGLYPFSPWQVKKLSPICSCPSWP